MDDTTTMVCGLSGRARAVRTDALAPIDMTDAAMLGPASAGMAVAVKEAMERALVAARLASSRDG